MSLKLTDLLYVNRGGTLYQVSWARIRDRRLLGADELLVQRGDTMYRVAIGDFWNGSKELDELDILEVERGGNGIYDQTNPGYEGVLYRTSLNLPPFFAIDLISDQGAGGPIKVGFRYKAKAYQGDPEGARVQRPDGTFAYVGNGTRLIPLVEDGVYRFTGDFSIFEIYMCEGSSVDASLTPGATWNLMHANNPVFGEKLFETATLVGVPEGLELRSLNKTFHDTKIAPYVNLNYIDTSACTTAANCFENSDVAGQDTSSWVMSSVTNMAAMFQGASRYTGNGIDLWDCSAVTNMQAMFEDALTFNGDLSSWNLASVENLQETFKGASAFNRTLSAWVLPKLEKCTEALAGTKQFNSNVWPVLSEKVTDLSSLFDGARNFNQGIPWNTENVQSLYKTFGNASRFNSNLSGWDTSNVTNLSGTFSNADSFNSDISGWDVSAAESMDSMFEYSQAFNVDISSWDTSNVSDMDRMFQFASLFNQDISSWCVSLISNEPVFFDDNSGFQNLTSKQPQWGTCPSTNEGRFYINSGTLKLNFRLTSGKSTYLVWPSGSSQTYTTNSVVSLSLSDLGEYELDMTHVKQIYFTDSNSCEFDFHPEFYTGKVTDLTRAFKGCWLFNGDISNWNVSNVYTMNECFYDAKVFEGDLSQWDVSNVTDMIGVFGKTMKVNNCNIEGWDTSKVQKLNYAFEFNPSFNVDVSAWDVSNVTEAESLFKQAESFNQDISGMNWEKNQAFRSMFDRCHVFNVDISAWDTATATSMDTMFNNCYAFDQDISSWCVPKILVKPRNFDLRSNSEFRNHPERQPQWGTCPIRVLADPVISKQGGGNTVEAGEDAVVVSDAIFEGTPPIDSTQWQHKTQGTSDAWADISGATSATYTVGVADINGELRVVQTSGQSKAYSNVLTVMSDPTGAYVGVTFFDGADSDVKKIKGVKTTAGTITFQDGTVTAIGPGDFDFTASKLGTYILTSDDLTYLSFEETKTDLRIDDRSDLSSITNAKKMFLNCQKFNQDLSWWDVSKVTNMLSMFNNAYVFNQDISSWNTSNVTNMGTMFSGAEAFDQYIGDWDTSNVKSMEMLFYGTKAFNQDIGRWNLTNVEKIRRMFAKNKVFNQDIGDWDVSNVKDMSYMFNCSAVFNQDISGWDTSNVTNMDVMFTYANVFNQDISTWCVTQIPKKPSGFDSYAGFANQTALQPRWGTCPGDFPGSGTVTLTSGTLKISGFSDGSAVITGPNNFSQTINGDFDLGNGVSVPGDYELPMGQLTRLSFPGSSNAVFDFAPDFYTGNLSDIRNLFANCRLFNGDVSNWDTANIVDISSAFYNAFEFDGDLSNWNTSNVRSLSAVFHRAYNINQVSVQGWDTSNVTDMGDAFKYTTFDSIDLSGWDFSNVVNMCTFFYENFNVTTAGLATGDFANNTDFSRMLGSSHGAMAYNEDISAWNTSSALDMSNMFRNAAQFSQDLSVWCVPNIKNKPVYFDTAAKAGWANNTTLQPQWGTCPVAVTKEPVIQASAGGFGPVDVGDEVILQSTGITDPNGSLSFRWQRETVKDSGNWVDISGQTGINYITTSADQDLAVRLVETHTLSDGRTQDVPSNSIEVGASLPVDPTRVVGVQLSGGTLNIKGNKTGGGIIYHVDSGSTVYTMPSGSFSTSVSASGLYLIESVGLTSLNFDESKTAVFELDSRSYMNDIVNTADMFYNCWEFNQDLSWWDVSNVTNMAEMFGQARKFNSSLSSWNTGKVTNMAWMFYNCKNMTIDLSNLNTSNATNLSRMFQNCVKQRTNVSGWNVTKGQNFEGMFYFLGSGWNPAVGNWNMANATNLSAMFYNTRDFNYDISGWNTGKVTNMSAMFAYSNIFNVDIGSWDTSNVSDMALMFQSAQRFNQDLSGWCVTKIGSKPSQFDGGSGFYNQTALQPKWGSCPPKITSNPVIY